MKNYLKTVFISREMESENPNPITGVLEKYVRIRMNPLCERANEFAGGARNAFRRLWKSNYSDAEWASILSGKAISVGTMKSRDIVEQKWVTEKGVERSRVDIVLAVFEGETDQLALDAASFGENKAVFLPDKQEEELAVDVKLVEEEPVDDTAKTVAEVLEMEEA